MKKYEILLSNCDWESNSKNQWFECKIISNEKKFRLGFTQEVVEDMFFDKEKNKDIFDEILRKEGKTREVSIETNIIVSASLAAIFIAINEKAPDDFENFIDRKLNNSQDEDILIKSDDTLGLKEDYRQEINEFFQERRDYFISTYETILGILRSYNRKSYTQYSSNEASALE